MIYILEDDASIRKLVVYTLQSQGMEAQGFDRPSQFWEAMEKGSPELVLLDIMLPEEDGLQVLKRLRSMPATKTLPVIMLTAKSTEYDKVLGLDEGAWSGKGREQRGRRERKEERMRDGGREGGREGGQADLLQSVSVPFTPSHVLPLLLHLCLFLFFAFSFLNMG